ncbi:hypothetical protein T492DRAFT_910065 [Pavlovales sp. CCMP2436]|nr:hypothetical protein T492DRAFT_910065 [Pavlovales sp. CCMP2436]
MMLLDKIELCGRLLKIGRPSGYVETGFPSQPLNVSMLRITGAPTPNALNPFITQQIGGYVQKGPDDGKQQRVLYVGNLAVGIVTGPMLHDLFQLPLQSMPGKNTPLFLSFLNPFPPSLPHSTHPLTHPHTHTHFDSRSSPYTVRTLLFSSLFPPPLHTHISSLVNN